MIGSGIGGLESIVKTDQLMNERTAARQSILYTVSTD